jgi:hypothetical protein
MVYVVDEKLDVCQALTSSFCSYLLADVIRYLLKWSQDPSSSKIWLKRKNGNECDVWYCWRCKSVSDDGLGWVHHVNMHTNAISLTRSRLNQSSRSKYEHRTKYIVAFLLLSAALDSCQQKLPVREFIHLWFHIWFHIWLNLFAYSSDKWDTLRSLQS